MQSFVVRGRLQSTSGGRVVDNFDAALRVTDCPDPEPVIEWQGRDSLVCLDVDYHGRTPPADPHHIVNRLYPRPRWWWVSHGGGLKLVYLPAGVLTAEEVAFIARYVFRSMRGDESGVEVLTGTRHPLYPRGDQRCGPVMQNFVTDIGKAKAELLGDIDYEAEDAPDKLDEWLADNGWEKGRRYAHDRCPIAPTTTGERDPVECLDKGIHCWICKNKGNAYGRLSKPGFAPYRLLIEGEPARVRNDLRAAVKNVTHWDHARHIIDDKDAYKALLKLWHGVAKDKAFFPVLPIVRGRGVWLDARTFAPASRDGLEKIIESLPAVHYTDDKGKERISRTTLGIFQGGSDLTEYGYPPIVPLRGVDVGRRDRDLCGTDQTIFAVSRADPPFRYRDVDDRGSIDYEGTLRMCFPGVDLDLLRLLVAAKGRVQSGAFQNAPQFYLTGQSGAGKSVHVLLAAELCCDTAEIINVEQTNTERLLQQYAAASERAGFALFNEADKSKLRDADLRNLALQFERGKGYHGLYVGRRTIETPAVVAYTGQLLPDLLRRDAQTARRVVHVAMGAGVLGEGKDWHRTCGNGSVLGWRRQVYLNTDAADALVSDVIDRFFGRGLRWEDVVRACGFTMLAEEACDDRAEYRRLFDLACAGTGEDHPRWSREAGWVVFSVEGKAPIAVLYRDLTTGEGEGEDRASLLAANWGDVVGVPGVECEVKHHGSRRAIRFRSGKAKVEGTRYNGEIVAGSRPAKCQPLPGNCQPIWQ